MTGSVGTFERIVVKNGPTLTLIDKHAVFLLTAETVANTPCRGLWLHGERLNRQSKSRTNTSFRNMSEWILPSKSVLPVLFWIPG